MSAHVPLSCVPSGQTDRHPLNGKGRKSMSERKQTFHVYVRAGKGQYYFTRMAVDSDAARREAEADGHSVVKVRRAPTPARGGRQGV
jgi:hypothetical protein